MTTSICGTARDLNSRCNTFQISFVVLPEGLCKLAFKIIAMFVLDGIMLPPFLIDMFGVLEHQIGRKLISDFCFRLQSRKRKKNPTDLKIKPVNFSKWKPLYRAIGEK